MLGPFAKISAAKELAGFMPQPRIVPWQSLHVVNVRRPQGLFNVEQHLGFGCDGQAFFRVASTTQLDGLVAHVLGLGLDI